MYQQINLYQPIFRRQRQVFSASVMLQAVALVSVALLTIYAYGLWQVIGLEAEIVRLEGREKANTARLAGLDSSVSLERRLKVDAELASLNEELLRQQKLIEVLRDEPLGQTAGFSDRLAALARRHSEGLWLTRVAIDGGTGRMELAGASVRPELVPQYLQRLGEEPALSGQRFETLAIERSEGAEVVQFRVSSEALQLGGRRQIARQP